MNRIASTAQESAAALDHIGHGNQDGIENSATHELVGRWVEYHQRVIGIYSQEQIRLNALATSEPQAWRTLWEQLNRSAYRMLVQKGISASFSREKSAEIAQQTCERIFASVFPCDVPFDYWAQTILKNVVLHYLTRSRDLLDRQPLISSLDELDERGIDHPMAAVRPVGGHTPVQDVAATTTEVQSLIEAIERMRSAEWRAVIVYTYFSGLSDDEIASRLGRTKGFVQTMRHRALKQLRQMCRD
jgi:RNA polymerase sigma factor (sigma-70 family)